MADEVIEAWEVQVSLKNRKGDLLNVRGQTFADVRGHLVDIFTDKDQMEALLDTFTATPPEPVVEQVAGRTAAAFNGSVIDEVPNCPACGGDMWDNRQSKKNAKAPDFTCKDTSCLNDKGYRTGAWVAKRNGRDA